MIKPPHKDVGGRLKCLLNKNGYEVAIGTEKHGTNYLNATTAYKSEGLEVISRIGQEKCKARIFALSTKDIKWRVVVVFAIIKSQERGGNRRLEIESH